MTFLCIFVQVSFKRKKRSYQSFINCLLVHRATMKLYHSSIAAAGFTTVTVVLVLVTILLVPGSIAQDELLCRGQKLNMTDQQFSFITACLKEFGFNSIWDITTEKIPCFGVCALDKKGLLTADGKLDHDKIYDYVYHVMQPEEVRKPLVDGTEKCIKDHGQAVRIPNDPECIQYFEAGQCVHMLFHEVCFA